MAGLDTRGVFDGFAQGFGLVDNYLNNKAADERANRQQDMHERGLQMREQEFAAQQEDQRRQQDQQLIGQFYSGWSNGIEAPMTEELDRAFKRNPMADPRHLFNPKTEAAVQYADKLASGEGNLFSKETADHMHNFFQPRIDRMPGRSTRLAGLYPGQREGTLAFEVGVTPKGGLDGVDSKEYFAPVTVNRGVAGQDDEVAQYGIDQMIAPVMGAKQIYQALNQHKDKMLGYLQGVGYLPKGEKWEQVQGPDGSVLQRNSVTGELKSVLGREPRLGMAGGGAYAPSSDVKTLQWLMAPEGGNLDAQAARNELVRMKRGGADGGISAGDRYRIDFLGKQIKEIDSQLASMTASPEEETALQQQRAQLVAQRNNMAGQLGLTGAPIQSAQEQRQSATTQQRKAPQANQQQPAALQAGHIEDGYEFLGGDPANPESWRKK